MVAPSPSWNTVRVFGTWSNLDGTLKAGKATLTIPVRVVNTPNDVIFPAGKFEYPLLTASTYHYVGSQAEMLALSAAVGDIAIRTDLDTVPDYFLLTAAPATTLGNWSTARSFDQLLPSNDDPDNTPTGWQPKIVVKFDDQSTAETYVIDTPLAGPAVDLASVVLTQSFTTTDVLIRGVPGGIAALDDDGFPVGASGARAPFFVFHGTDPNVARPYPAGVGFGFWVGTAEPVNADTTDVVVP